jgi:hypothetical protein
VAVEMVVVVMLVEMQVLALVVLTLVPEEETAETAVALVFTTQATTGQVQVEVPADMLAMVVRELYLIAQQPLGAQVLAVEEVEVAQVMALLAEMAGVALEF